MVQTFEKVIEERRYGPNEAAMMREAYLAAAAALELSDTEDRQRLATLIQSLGRLEHFPGAPALTSLAVDWYVSGRTVERL